MDCYDRKGAYKQAQKSTGGAENALERGQQRRISTHRSWKYGELRKAWEQAVEEVLLNKVVIRFGDSVETNRLEKLTDITVEDITMVNSEMTKCSGFVRHEAAANSTDIPEPNVVERDIKKLSDWVKELRTTRDRG